MSWAWRCSIVMWLGIPLVAGVAFAGSNEMPTRVSEWVSNLSADEPAKRTAAIREMERREIAESSALLQTDDAEALSQVASIQTFNARLNRWMAVVSSLSTEARREQVTLLRQPMLLPALSRCFSDSSDQRAEGVRELCQSKIAGVERLLIYFLQDNSAEVVIAALDTLWDRPASVEIVNAVWELARPHLTATPAYRARADTSTKLMFHGQAIVLAEQHSAAVQPGVSEAAVVLLERLKGPDVAARTTIALKEICTQLKSQDPNDFSTAVRFFGPLGVLSEMALAVNAKESVPALADIALTPVGKNGEMTLSQPGEGGQMENTYLSTRTGALRALSKLTGPEGASFETAGSIQAAKTNDGWPTINSRAAEEQALREFKKWWGEHQGEYASGTLSVKTNQPAAGVQ